MRVDGLEIRMKRIGTYLHISFSLASGLLFVYRKRADGKWDVQRAGKKPAVVIQDGDTTRILNTLAQTFDETEGDYHRHTDGAMQ